MSLYRGRVFGFEIQHLFPNAIISEDSVPAENARLLLSSIGFDVEWRGNKMPLLINPFTRDAILAAPEAVRQVFVKAGFGFNWHDSQTSGGNHPGYNRFIIDTLGDTYDRANMEGWNDTAKERAVFDLHRFVKSINIDGQPPVVGSDFSSFDTAWDSYKQGLHGTPQPDYENLSTDAVSAIDGYSDSSNFNKNPVDVNSDANSQMRYEVVTKLSTESNGILNTGELTNAADNLNQANSNGNNSGHASAASISLIHDLQKRSATPISDVKAVIENLSALGYRFMADKSGSVPVDAASGAALLRLINDKITGIFDTIGSYADSFADTFSSFGDTLIGEMVKSSNQLLVGLGGNILGDAVEFLNHAYDAIKKGFQTGDWSDLGDTIVEFGIGAVLSAILVTGSIVVTTAVVGAFSAGAAPIAAAFVAAGWAAYGLYDAVTNGTELLGKITADLADVFAKIGKSIEEAGDKFLEIIETIGRVISTAFATDFEIPAFDAINENLYLVDTGDISLPDTITGSDENERFYGSNNAFVDAAGGNDEIYMIRSSGEARGGEGDDILVGNRPVFISKGDYINEQDRQQAGQNQTLPEEDRINIEGPIAETDLRLVLNGEAGDDWLLVGGGTGAILVGGEGRDFLFNTSFKGQLYGDTLDGVGQSTSGIQDSDVFWYWPSTFIMDAQPNDILQMFGWPLLGGSNSVAGIYAGDGSLAIDWLNWTVFYGATKSGQLLIFNAIAMALGIGAREGDDFPAGVMVVEDYDFGGWKDAEWGRPAAGDLGLTFRIAANRSDSVEISLWNFVWGHLFTVIDVFFNLAKLVRWQPVDDPLVLDLDGDGIETVSQSQSGVHFDMDGDYFAEQTGWVGADDGFLVIDKNGNGVIDDITEMFGAPDVGGYQELAALDDVANGGNADGFITADDAMFAELRVWRDLDQDGETDEGELFSLEELDIVSLDVNSTALDDHITPQGTTLRETATFTRGDGSVGNTFEAVFETNATDTIYRGDKGISEWLKNTQIPTAKGLGAMAELAVDVSNDFELGQIVLDAANSMTVADLKLIREQAKPVFGAWSQSLELTRELTPVLLSRDGEGVATLVDRGVYVEDEAGGYWALNSGAPVLDGDGNPIERASLEDVLAMQVSVDHAWQLEQVFSPTSRAQAVQHRENAPYLVEIVDERAVVLDYGIQNEDGSWHLASGNDVTDGLGNVIATPTLEDVLSSSHADNSEWRTEEIDFNPFADLPVDQMGVQLIDGVVTDYSVAITDADGTFHVWARNLDRALELQHKLGRPGEFALRNYELDFDTLDEVGSTDDSAYRVELMTAGQLHFSSSIYGVDFQPQIMAAETDLETGFLTYSVGSFNGEDAVSETEDGQYVSTIKPAIELFDVMMQNYINVSRGFAVRLALQGGLADFARELAYDPDTDQFRATGDRELAPMFEAIFEGAPAGSETAYDYLVDWHEVLQVVYPDYYLDSSTNILSGTLKLDQKFIFQMIIPAIENVGIDADLESVMNALGVDETLLIAHEAGDAQIEGTGDDDFIYLTGGDQTYEGGYGQDTYFVGKDFGVDVIDDREEPLRPHSPDELRFAQAKSTDIYATRDGLDLVLEVIGTDDVLRIRDQFLGDLIDPLFGYNFAPDTGVSSIIFADGVIWNLLDIAQAVSHPLDSDDLVLGSEIRDWIEASRGNDILRGGRDGDIYIFRQGDGDDRIDDANDRPTDDPVEKADVLQFLGEGITPENIAYHRAGESDDLVMTVLDDDGNETGDRIQIDNQFDWFNVPFLGLIHGNRLERIAFEDGSFLTEADVMARVLEDAKTDGEDIIYGFNNADTLDGGAGNDVLTGRAQSDTYIYGRAYGRDVIEDGHDDFFGSGFDVLRFKDDLRWSDIEFIREGSSATITMQVAGTLDEVILKDQFKNFGFGGFGYANLIEEFQFGDGTTWSYARLGQHVIDLASSDSDDTIYGFDIADRLDGGLGDDRLEGGASSDTYVFARGYGEDVIFDTSSSGQGDMLLMQDIAFLDVDVSRDDNDLIFTVHDTGERLILEDQYVRDGQQTHALETFRFSDQDVSFEFLNPKDVDLIGTSASETLTGSDFGEIIDGRGGDDTLIGNSDGDTYLFGIGYGDDVIFDTQKRVAWLNRDGKSIKETDDTVRFGSDITIDNLIYTKDGNDLLISITDYTDTLRIRNQFASIAEGVEWFEYEDGSRLHISDVEERLAIVGGSRGDDVINGALDSENVLDGRQGDDELYGGRLADTYAFGAAYDLDRIIEREDAQVGSIDRIVFGSIVDPETVQVIRDGNDLIIDLGNGEDRVTIVDGLTTRQVEQFLFADGTQWGLETVRDRLLTGSNNDDVLIGFDDRDDRLDGKGGSDALEGGQGDDTYVFGIGSGDDSVEDTGGTDRIEFGETISTQQLEFSRQDDDLLVQLKDEDDTLIILGGALSASGLGTIEQFVFADGTVLEISDILRSLVQGEATPGHDVIDARGVGPIEIDAGEGDDLVIGGDETTFAFYVGDGSDIIDTRGEVGESRIVFYDLESTEAVVRKPDIDGSDVLISFPNAGDQVIVRGALSDSNVNAIRFADGVEWTKEALVREAILSQLSDRGDTITGSDLADEIAGGFGDDDIAGGAGDDIYTFRAGDGRDVIQDVSGTDRLEIRGYRPGEVLVSKPVSDRDEWLLRFEGSEDEILLRGTGIETIAFGDGTAWSLAQMQEMAVGQGTQFNDVLDGSDTANTLAGLEGDDAISGKGGDDSYIYRRGDGRDIIDDQGFASDINQLVIKDYGPLDVRLLRFEDRADDLIMQFAGGDELVLIGQFDENGHHMSSIAFEDGTVWTNTNILAALLVQRDAESGEELIGTSGSDRLEGLRGDDLLSGLNGADTYVFNRGDGRDAIEDNGSTSSTQIDVIEINGYVAGEIIFQTSLSDPNNLLISFEGSTDEILVVGGIDGSTADRIELVRLADGAEWTYSQMIALALENAGTTGDDGISGGSNPEVLSGGLGNDFLSGGDASDLYIFNRGDGRDAIEDNGAADTDRLEIRGYTPAEAILSREGTGGTGGDDLRITFVGTDDEIILYNAIDGSYGDGIEEIAFDDGTVWTPAEIRTMLVEQDQTSGDDRINGFGYAETIEGGLGNDFLSGGDASDLYIFNRGDGRDAIEDNGAADTDRLEIRGYTPAEAILSREGTGGTGGDDLRITFVGTDDEIILYNAIDGSYGDGIEEVAFDDGTVWTPAEIRTMLVEQDQTSGDDRINGFGYAETIEGGLGNDFLSGGDASDLYIFNRGDGRDAIEDNGAADTDRLEIRGYTPAEAILSREGTGGTGGDDLRITFVGTDDEIILYNAIDGSYGDGIEEIAFDDGTVWTPAEIRTMLVEQDQTSGDDRINGFGYAETIEGGLGNDFLSGGDASDLYIFNRGDGRDAIEDNGAADTDRLEIRGYTPAEAILSREGTGGTGGDDLRITFVGTDDEIILYNAIDGSYGDGIEEIAFDDGTVWTTSDVVQQLNNSIGTYEGSGEIVGTVADDSLSGSGGDDILAGLDGGDTYIFASGSQIDTVFDQNTIPGHVDKVVFEDLVSSEIQLVRRGLDLRIISNQSQDEVLVWGQFYPQSDNYFGIEEIHFADGEIYDSTFWDGLSVSGSTIQTVPGGNTYGTSGDDIFEVGSGDHNISSGAGSETYLFSSGFGNVFLNEIDGSLTSLDVVVFTDLSSSDVELSRTGNDAFLTELATGMQIELDEQFYSSDYWGVEQIVFSDGVLLDRDAIQAPFLLPRHIRDRFNFDFITGRCGDFRWR